MHGKKVCNLIENFFLDYRINEICDRDTYQNCWYLCNGIF